MLDKPKFTVQVRAIETHKIVREVPTTSRYSFKKIKKNILSKLDTSKYYITEG